ncbi:MAG: hypothetical protein NUW37_03180 [Planctomycetes bacterium]|nr:hypothetical protein [Planctomycetota bacterium]
MPIRRNKSSASGVRRGSSSGSKTPSARSAKESSGRSKGGGKKDPRDKRKEQRRQEDQEEKEQAIGTAKVIGAVVGGLILIVGLLVGLNKFAFKEAPKPVYGEDPNIVAQRQRQETLEMNYLKIGPDLMYSGNLICWKPDSEFGQPQVEEVVPFVFNFLRAAKDPNTSITDEMWKMWDFGEFQNFISAYPDFAAKNKGTEEYIKGWFAERQNRFMLKDADRIEITKSARFGQSQNSPEVYVRAEVSAKGDEKTVVEKFEWVFHEYQTGWVITYFGFKEWHDHHAGRSQTAEQPASSSASSAPAPSAVENSQPSSSQSAPTSGSSTQPAVAPAAPEEAGLTTYAIPAGDRHIVDLIGRSNDLSFSDFDRFGKDKSAKPMCNYLIELYNKGGPYSDGEIVKASSVISIFRQWWPPRNVERETYLWGAMDQPTKEHLGTVIEYWQTQIR